MNTMTLPKMASYFNQPLMVSIVVPEAWSGTQVDDSKFRLFGLPESGFEEYFDEYRVSLSYERRKPDSSGQDWFKQLVAKNNATMAEDYNEYKLLEESFYDIGSYKTYKKHYSWREEQTGLQLVQLQALLVGSPYALYVVNAAVLEPLAEQYMPIFDSILNSTRIIPRS